MVKNNKQEDDFKHLDYIFGCFSEAYFFNEFGYSEDSDEF